MKTIFIIYMAISSFHSMRKIDTYYRFKVAHRSGYFQAIDSMMYAMIAYYLYYGVK